MKKFTLSQAVLKRIRSEAEKAVQAFAAIETERAYARMTLLLAMFALKRPDIGYQSGMSLFLYPLLSLFSSDADAFILFSHLVECVFPDDFFASNNRFLSAHVEYRVFAMSVEKLRPKLVKALKAVYTTATLDQRSQESDFSPFVTTMKRLAESWFGSLFATAVDPGEWLRIGDAIMVYGFEGIQKIAAGLVSEWERGMINVIKAETKEIGLGSSVDVLLAAGTSARLRFLHRFDHLPIDPLLRKCLTKPAYTSISRSSLLSAAAVVEKNYLERLVRLRQTRSIIGKQGLVGAALEGLPLVENEVESGEIAREAFMRLMTQRFLWSPAAALNLFVTVDQRGGNTANFAQLKAILAVLGEEAKWESCVKRLFVVFARGEHEDMEPSDIVDMLTALELSLDIRSSSFQSASQSLYTSLQAKAVEGRVTLEVYSKTVAEEQACNALLEFVRGVVDERFVPGEGMKLVVDFEGEVSFEEIHSPIQVEITTPVSELSDLDQSFSDSPSLKPVSESSPPDLDDPPQPLILYQDFHFEEPKDPVFSVSPAPVLSVKSDRQKCGRLCSPEVCVLS